jgi:hypothetical protein
MLRKQMDLTLKLGRDDDKNMFSDHLPTVQTV